MVTIPCCIGATGISTQRISFKPALLGFKVGRVINACFPKREPLFVFINKVWGHEDLVKKVPFIAVGQGTNPFFEQLFHGIIETDAVQLASFSFGFQDFFQTLY